MIEAGDSPNGADGSRGQYGKTAGKILPRRQSVSVSVRPAATETTRDWRLGSWRPFPRAVANGAKERNQDFRGRHGFLPKMRRVSTEEDAFAN